MFKRLRPRDAGAGPRLVVNDVAKALEDLAVHSMHIPMDGTESSKRLATALTKDNVQEEEPTFLNTRPYANRGWPNLEDALARLERPHRRRREERAVCAVNKDVGLRLRGEARRAHRRADELAQRRDGGGRVVEQRVDADGGLLEARAARRGRAEAIVAEEVL